MKNNKGFTLIELLAVITIMGILMIVAIPAITRTIENSRKDTFINTVQNYVNGLKTMWSSDNLSCIDFHDNSQNILSSSVSAGFYYVEVDSSNLNVPQLLESGGDSPWGNRVLKGYILVHVYDTVAAGADGNIGTADDVFTRKTDYYPVMTDDIHGINVNSTYALANPSTGLKKSDNLTRGDLFMSGVTYNKTGWTSSVLTPPKFWEFDESTNAYTTVVGNAAKRCVER